MEGETDSFYQQKHVINITIASQMRLHDILNNIKDLDAKYPVDTPEKQKCYLALVRQYLIGAIPYISENDAIRYGKELMEYSVKKKSNVSFGVQRVSYDFDPELDRRLNEMLIELQIKLRPIFTKLKDENDDNGL